MVLVVSALISLVVGYFIGVKITLKRLANNIAEKNELKNIKKICLDEICD